MGDVSIYFSYLYTSTQKQDKCNRSKKQFKMVAQPYSEIK